MRDARFVVTCAVVVLSVFAVGSALPWATSSQRASHATPTVASAPLATPFVVPAGTSACLEPVTLTPEVHGLAVRVLGKGRTPPLSAQVSTLDGFAAEGRAAAGAGDDRGTVVIGLRSPPQDAPRSGLCVRNDGADSLTLAGNNTNRWRTPDLLTTVGGQPSTAQFGVTLVGERASLLSRVGELADRAATLMPYGSAWVLFSGVVAVLGMVGGLLTALVLAARQDDTRR